MTDSIGKLNPKQDRFASEFIIDLNGKQAAIRAGYSPKTAEMQASRLLRHVKVQAKISELQAARAKRTGITSDMVLVELAKLGFANMQDYMTSNKEGLPLLDFGALTRDQAAALQEVTVDSYVDASGEDKRTVKRVKFKLADKRAALVDIGRHLGMFPTKVEHTGKDGADLIPPMDDYELARRIGLVLQRATQGVTLN